jgi:hypothetical protein
MEGIFFLAMAMMTLGTHLTEWFKYHPSKAPPYQGEEEFILSGAIVVG